MKNKLNYELLEFHIREAAGELDSLLSRIQFMLGRLDKAGDLQVDVWGDLNEAGVLDVAAECKDLGALGALGAHGGEALRAVQDYLRDVCKCFDVVLGSGLSEKTLYGRERRTASGFASVALD